MLAEGDVIKLEKGMKVYTEVPETFVYSNRKGSFKLTQSDVEIGKGFENWLEGEYVVIKTQMEGGGTGHGANDIYPDGHRVYCEKVEDISIKCSFYQSGCFTAMITEINPISKAKLKWTIEVPNKEN